MVSVNGRVLFSHAQKTRVNRMDAAPVLKVIAKALHKARLEALKKESQRNLIEQIRRQLALPMNRRTHFLRKRLPGGGSCL